MARLILLLAFGAFNHTLVAATIFTCEESARLVKQIAEARDAGVGKDEVIESYRDATGDLVALS